MFNSPSLFSTGGPDRYGFIGQTLRNNKKERESNPDPEIGGIPNRK